MPRESKENLKKRAAEIFALLKRYYPDSRCSLEHQSPLQLLVATILSAQCTDERVNKVTPALFTKYKTVKDFADADIGELEAHVRTTGFFRNKAKNIKTCCQQILERHGGEIPRTLEELSSLAGVGRKTANVVLGSAFGIPGVVVDTHVGRLSRRMGFTENEDPVKVECDLEKIFPREEWTDLAHLLIWHGREICLARRAECEHCFLAHGLCPKIGVDKKTGKPIVEKGKKKNGHPQSRSNGKPHLKKNCKRA